MDGDGAPRLRDTGVILERVAQLSMRELGADSAVIAMAGPHGLTSTVYATDDRARALAISAYTLGEGPCLSALRDYEVVLVADLDDASTRERWPVWTQAAATTGLRSVAAFPIRAGAIAAGALSVFSELPGRFDGTAIARGQRFADAAFLGLLDLRAGLDHGVDGGALPTGLRADVHRAAGMMMAQADLTIDDALTRLRAFAFSSGRLITDVAEDVLAGRTRFGKDEDGTG